MARAPGSKSWPSASWGNFRKACPSSAFDNCMDHSSEFTGTTTSPHIGDEGQLGVEKRRGKYFHAYLQQRNVLAANATIEIHGPGHTRAGKDIQQRIDYICLPCGREPTAKYMKVLEDFATHREDEDHCPTIVALTYIEKANIRRCGIPVDRAKLRDSKAQQELKDEIATIPLPPYRKEMNDHASYLAQQVHEAGIKAFKTDRSTQEIHAYRRRRSPSSARTGHANCRCDACGRKARASRHW
eukprot:1884793-Pyramimonas_sp.AAC.1